MRKLLTIRKSVALAAVLTASALSLAAVPASASSGHTPAAHTSAISPDTAFSGVQLCEIGDGLCMSGHDGNPGLITAEPFATGVAETVNIINAAECGGTVEYKPNASPAVFCPFADHALDNQYKGDDLVVIQNTANLLTYRTPDDIAVYESGAGDGEVWVQDGNFLAGSGPAAHLINVQASADVGSAVVACAAGRAGGGISMAFLGNSGLCAWRVIN